MSDDKKQQVAIVDYHMGNLFNVQKACEHVGLSSKITHDKQEILEADGLILPGVGAFGDAMCHLQQLDLVEPIRDYVASKKPFMGICLGLQLLMSSSDEFGIHKGLDIIKGRVVKFPEINESGERIKVPQVGWNQIFPAGSGQNVFPEDSSLHHITPGEYMYFVHSYFVVPDDEKLILSKTTYEDINFCSGIQKENIFAVQYHPEKSSTQGLEIYENWSRLVKQEEILCQ